MLLDGIPFSDIWRSLRGDSPFARSISQLARFMEDRLGARFLYDARTFGDGEPHLADLYERAARLREAGVIRRFGRLHEFHDEPPFSNWYVECATKEWHVSGGMAVADERRAFTAALAEAVERYIWFSSTDYFSSTALETATAARKRDHIIEPQRFAGFSPDQRAADARLSLSDSARYTWIDGHSHVSDSRIRLPAQIVSGKHGIENMRAGGTEPIILEPITTGLATGPTREWALLGGALEIIERDAFMITWLNQITPPRISLSALAARSDEVAQLLRMCKRYKLTPTVVHLPTDAPTFAVCAIVRDESGAGPEVSVGLRADRDLASAVRGAMLEALRIRLTIRYRARNVQLGSTTGNSPVVHLERADYWATGGRHALLDFLTSGAEHTPSASWENDGDTEHLERIIEWCRETGYEFASVDMSASKANVTDWHVHFVVMPDLMPMHQNERFAYRSGTRLTEVPRQFGYEPRNEPYLEHPHPFA